MDNQPPPDAAEASFRRGLDCLEKRSYQEAATCFQAAIDIDRQEGSKVLRPRYVSYIGLAMTLAHGRSADAVQLCEQAVRREFFDPDLYCNLGIVYLRNRRRGEAFKAFKKGLKLRPRHPRIRQVLERYDERCEPTLAFLPRSHPVNRFIGRVRTRLRELFHRDSAAEV
jgi:tetratricopeptide (TPR) repeat protein